MYICICICIYVCSFFLFLISKKIEVEYFFIVSINHILTIFVVYYYLIIIMNSTTIFRFKFSNEFIEQLTPFAKLHQYSDRHVYKEEWSRWVANNDELICNEGLRLKSIGYDGNIHDKMYRSGRYYFRNKTDKEVRTRRKYISLEHEIIVAMDNHISVNFHLHAFKPSSAYEQFCIEMCDLLTNELNRLIEDLTDGIRKEDIWSKFKKTYKNRYYLFQKNYSIHNVTEEGRRYLNDLDEHYSGENKIKIMDSDNTNTNTNTNTENK